MGLLGFSLLFVCIALLNNGVGALKNTDLKTRWLLNFVAGGTIVVAHFVAMASGVVSHLSLTAGFLRGFTYLLIAACMRFELDWNVFGWFSLVAAVYSVVNATVCFFSQAVPLGVLWVLWATLWFWGFLQFGCKIKKMEKLFPYVCIFEAIFAAGVPAVLMLLDVWPVAL